MTVHVVINCWWKGSQFFPSLHPYIVLNMALHLSPWIEGIFFFFWPWIWTGSATSFDLECGRNDNASSELGLQSPWITVFSEPCHLGDKPRIVLISGRRIEATWRNQAPFVLARGHHRSSFICWPPDTWESSHDRDSCRPHLEGTVGACVRPADS